MHNSLRTTLSALLVLGTATTAGAHTWELALSVLNPNGTLATSAIHIYETQTGDLVSDDLVLHDRGNWEGYQCNFLIDLNTSGGGIADIRLEPFTSYTFVFPGLDDRSVHYYGEIASGSPPPPAGGLGGGGASGLGGYTNWDDIWQLSTDPEALTHLWGDGAQELWGWPGAQLPPRLESMTVVDWEIEGDRYTATLEAVGFVPTGDYDWVWSNATELPPYDAGPTSYAYRTFLAGQTPIVTVELNDAIGASIMLEAPTVRMANNDEPVEKRTSWAGVKSRYAPN